MPGLVLLVGALALLAAAVGVPGRHLGSRWAGLVATIPVVAVVLMTAYVFGEDSYVGRGISRWARYDDNSHALYAAAVAFSLCAAGALLAATSRRRATLARLSIALCGLACAGCLITVIAFTLN